MKFRQGEIVVFKNDYSIPGQAYILEKYKDCEFEIIREFQSQINGTYYSSILCLNGPRRNYRLTVGSGRIMHVSHVCAMEVDD